MATSSVWSLHVSFTPGFSPVLAGAHWIQPFPRFLFVSLRWETVKTVAEDIEALRHRAEARCE